VRLRRILVVGGLAVSLAMWTAWPATATDDLSDYLTNAGDAVYSGRRVTGTVWDGVEAVGMIEIRHHDGMTYVGSGSHFTAIGAGRLHPGGVGEAAVSFAGESHPDLGARYTVEPGEKTVYLGRPARVVDVMEGPLLRMRMVVDDATSAPVATEVYGPDGDVFRYATMVEFSVSAGADAPPVESDDDEMMVPLTSNNFPSEISGYQLIDVYGGPHDTHQAFYSDGLFSFSVFAEHGWTDWHASTDDEFPYVVDGASYLRVVGPSSVWVMWNTRDASLALVGDLPPDHIEQVLERFPRPSRRAWYKAFWFRVFG